VGRASREIISRAAAARRIDWTMRSIVSVPRNTTGDTVLNDRKFGIPCHATASGSSPKRAYKPRRGPNEISVLSRSCYRRSLRTYKAVIWRTSTYDFFLRRPRLNRSSRNCRPS
jgi:hypothetical protein